MQFKRFLADIVCSLVNAVQRPVGRPSLDAEEPTTKACRLQGNLNHDTRKDGVDHIPQWNEKCQRCLNNKTGFSQYQFAEM